MPHPAVQNEQVLSRQLSAAHQTTMALGGAIGTGLFLASGLSVNVAGPAIILSYVIVAGISMLLGRALTEPQRRRWVELMLDAADRAGLPDDPEFRSAFVAYIEWGTRLALNNSQPGAKPPAEAPVPRWGWGEAPPYTG